MSDNLTKSQRSYNMSRIKSKNTALELKVFNALESAKVNFGKHDKELPGKPDIVFYKTKTAVFIDSDFWHGWKLKTWESKLSDFWRKKISYNENRDKRNNKILRSIGWKPVRVWGHQLKKNFNKYVKKIQSYA